MNSGEKIKKASISAFEKQNYNLFVDSISEKSLRYDLTVPFARFIVEHQNELSFPFKRYQIQPVWRADRPQHGRYQEFYQCDADMVGSDSLIYEIEQIKLFDQILSDLNIPSFTIQLNNRKLLSGIAEVFNCSDKFMDLVVAIDKVDKVGLNVVCEELEKRGFEKATIEQVRGLLSLDGSNLEKLKEIQKQIKDSEIGMKGINELTFILEYIDSNYSFRNGKLKLNLSLARGLNYYTGSIFEVTVDNFKMGSICGGGRYDNLTELFGLPGVSGVGISFGADRIYDVLETMELFPNFNEGKKKVLLALFEDSNIKSLLNIQDYLRTNNVSCEIYSKANKIQKQMKYANENAYSHVIFQGEKELKENQFTLKELASGVAYETLKYQNEN